MKRLVLPLTVGLLLLSLGCGSGGDPTGPQAPNPPEDPGDFSARQVADFTGDQLISSFANVAEASWVAVVGIAP